MTCCADLGDDSELLVRVGEWSNARGSGPVQHESRPPARGTGFGRGMPRSETWVLQAGGETAAPCGMTVLSCLGSSSRWRHNVAADRPEALTIGLRANDMRARYCGAAGVLIMAAGQVLMVIDAVFPWAGRKLIFVGGTEAISVQVVSGWRLVDAGAMAARSWRAAVYRTRSDDRSRVG